MAQIYWSLNPSVLASVHRTIMNAINGSTDTKTLCSGQYMKFIPQCHWKFGNKCHSVDHEWASNESHLLQLTPYATQCLLCRQISSNVASLCPQPQQHRDLCLYLCESAVSHQVDGESQNDERHGADPMTWWLSLQSDGCL
jgi:hypothetical protein